MPFFCPLFFPYFNTQLNEYDKNNHGNTYDKKRNTGWKREGEPRDYLPVHNSNLRNQHYKAT